MARMFLGKGSFYFRRGSFHFGRFRRFGRGGKRIKGDRLKFGRFWGRRLFFAGGEWVPFEEAPDEDFSGDSIFASENLEEQCFEGNSRGGAPLKVGFGMEEKIEDVEELMLGIMRHSGGRL